MLVQGRSWFTYLLSSNLQIRLWHHYLSHTNNARVIQALQLVDEIDLREAIRPNNKLYSSDSESDNKNNKFDKNADSKPTTINKTTEYNFNSMEELCKVYIKSKYIRNVKLKKMMPTTKRLQKIHIDL